MPFDNNFAAFFFSQADCLGSYWNYGSLDSMNLHNLNNLGLSVIIPSLFGHHSEEGQKWKVLQNCFVKTADWKCFKFQCSLRSSLQSILTTSILSMCLSNSGRFA